MFSHHAFHTVAPARYKRDLRATNEQLPYESESKTGGTACDGHSQTAKFVEEMI
jgi:hypothetical protein